MDMKEMVKWPIERREFSSSLSIPSQLCHDVLYLRCRVSVGRCLVWGCSLGRICGRVLGRTWWCLLWHLGCLSTTESAQDRLNVLLGGSPSVSHGSRTSIAILQSGNELVEHRRIQLKSGNLRPLTSHSEGRCGIGWHAVVAVSWRLAVAPVWMIITASPGTMRRIWLTSIARYARSLGPEYHLGSNAGIQVDVLVVANVGRTS